MQVTPFAPCDLAGMYRVCLATGDAGADASPRYRDPELLGHVYAGPYPIADPTLTWVVSDSGGVAGYVVGTADSQAFSRWQEESWWPALRARYPLPEPGTAVDDGQDAEPPATRDHELVRTVHTGTRYDPAITDRYPAHLHIDLLPRAQSRGIGRQLIGTLVDALRARGVPGLHLSVSEQNTGGIAFYDRVGFTTLERQTWGRTLGRDLR